MSKEGPIILVEDDPDDQEMISRIISRLAINNEIKTFHNGEEALDYFLTTTDMPFIILCDINMPLMNGLELKRSLEGTEGSRKRNAPFIYLTTTSNTEQIINAYQMNVQGFFVKGQTYTELKDTLTQIILYWKKCEYPRR